MIRDPVPPPRRSRQDEALWAILERGLRKDPKERWESMRALGEALSDWLVERGVAEDISGVPLRALWLGAPEGRVAGRSERPFAGEGMIRASIPMRARSEAPVVTSAALFAEVDGTAPAASRSRYFIMTGLALLTGALAWKIAFSPVNAPAHAAATRHRTSCRARDGHHRSHGSCAARADGRACSAGQRPRGRDNCSPRRAQGRSEVQSRPRARPDRARDGHALSLRGSRAGGHNALERAQAHLVCSAGAAVDGTARIAPLPTPIETEAPLPLPN